MYMYVGYTHDPVEIAFYSRQVIARNAVMNSDWEYIVYITPAGITTQEKTLISKY